MVISEDVLDDLNLGDPSDVLYLEFGAGGDYICIKQQADREPDLIWKVTNDTLDSILRTANAASFAEDLQYLSLGANGSWICCSKKETRWSGLHHTLTSALQRAQVQGVRILVCPNITSLAPKLILQQRVALCPVRSDRWWINLSDGTTQQQFVDLVSVRACILHEIPAVDSSITALATNDARYNKGNVNKRPEGGFVLIFL